MDKRLFRILLTLSLLSAVGGLILSPRLPDRIPIQWGFNGQPSNYASKYLAVLLPLGTVIAMQLLARVDPRGGRSPRAYGIISATVVGVMIVLEWIACLSVLGVPLPVGKLILAVAGAMFIIVGNYMPQVRSNYFLGFRTPWALSSDTVWRKTHLAGGVVFCIAGILTILGLFFPSGLVPRLSVVLLLAAVVGLYIYSYVIYKRLPKGGQGPGPVE